MKLLRRCFALGVAGCLIYRKPALLLGRLLVALPSAGFVAGAIVVCWGCPGRAMRDSSSGFARVKGPKDSTSECVVFCFRRGVATAASLFVGALLKPNVSCSGSCRCMLSVMGLCSGEGRIFPGVSFNLGGDACVEVERSVRLSLSSASWGRRVGRDHSPVGDVTVLVTFAVGGKGHALFVGANVCDLLRREGWDSVSKFQGAGWEAFIVLIVLLIVSPWRKGEDHERSTYKGGHNFVYRELVAGLGELPPSCGWPASYSSLSNLSVIEPSVGEVHHAVPEYTPSAFRGGSVRKDSSGTQANSMDCCRRRVEGLHGGIARCMVRCYRDRVICQHPILAHRLPTRESPTNARVTIHHPTIRREYAGTKT
ncbi:hypothetical protein CRG98_029537 [Punica granatum]|uniref:Uncharacterized protein n=1 Tax=Punica granatum TaxID=22663 RepID=A0A2I0J1E9_PUNGR|nr:hypothetical protein CRG98_029537 [Punica granatum]